MVDKVKYSSIVYQVAEDLHTKIRDNSLNSENEWWKKYPGN